MRSEALGVTIGIERVNSIRIGTTRAPEAKITSGLSSTRFAAAERTKSYVVAGPALVELGVDARRPTTFSQLLAEGAHARLHFRVYRRVRHQNSDPAHPLALLRACRERPRGGRAAEHRDELAPFHSITSSASCWRCRGTSRPSALAVLRLITSSNLLDWKTGKSAGFAPLRICPA